MLAVLRISSYVNNDDARFEVFTAVEMELMVCWFVAPCSVVVGYQRFGGPCCLRLQPWRWGKLCPPKRLYPTTTLHGATTQKTANYINEGVQRRIIW